MPVLKMTTKEITEDVVQSTAEKVEMLQSLDTSEKKAEQLKTNTKTCTEDNAEQVVPCMEGKPKEEPGNVPQNDLSPEQKSEHGEAENIPTEENVDMSTEEKQVEEVAKGSEEDEEERGEDETRTTEGNEEPPSTEPRGEAGEQKAVVLNLNNEVVRMRKEVNRVRTLIIRKLTRQITALKKKKGKENEVQKNQRRAARILEELHELKTLKQDVVTKIALQQEITFDAVCKNPDSTITDRALARIVTHPQFSKKIAVIKLAVKAFKEERMKKAMEEKEGNEADEGTRKLADANKAQRKQMEEEEDGEEQETSDVEEEEGDLREDGKPAQEDEVRSVPTAEAVSAPHGDISGISGSRKIDKVPRPVKTGSQIVSTELVKKTPQSKVSGKSPGRPSHPQKTREISSSSGEEEENIDDSEEDIQMRSPPLDGDEDAEDVNVTSSKDAKEVLQSNPESKATVRSPQRRATTVANRETRDDEEESDLESSDEDDDEDEETDDDGREERDKASKDANAASTACTVPKELGKNKPRSAASEKTLKPGLKVRQLREEEEEGGDLESTDEEEETDDSADERMGSSDSEREEVSKISNPTDAEDLEENEPTSGAADNRSRPTPNVHVEDENELESSDGEEEKEYFDDSTEERFRQRSSQSESGNEDDFFLGKVSRFKKKKGGSAKSKSGPAEQEGTSEPKPGPSGLNELESRLNSRGTKFTSHFCSSLSHSKDSSGGGQRFDGRGRGSFGGRGGVRGGGRGTFSSRPPKFQTCERGADLKGRPGSEHRCRDFTGRGSGRGRGDVRQPDQPTQSLHPSWEASKRRKEKQGQILAFQGKKIKFDDD